MADVNKIIADQIEAAKRAGKEYQGRPSDEPSEAPEVSKEPVAKPAATKPDED